MSRGLSVSLAVVLTATVGVWLAVLLFTITAPGGRCLPADAVVPPTSQPGPPVADWRPPQHRWETPPR